ncbi:MAG: hypothetical protein KGY74_10240, partial [Candidatus Cloacimonetes bacterium]|nr:hypothetical protein [Candidatus Cloacimonadota bacterium]
MERVEPIIALPELTKDDKKCKKQFVNWFKKMLEKAWFRDMVIKETADHILSTMPVDKFRKDVVFTDKENKIIDSFMLILEKSRKVKYLKDEIISAFDFEDISNVFENDIKEMIDDA